MQIYGIMVVRNEADILPVNILHHLALGIDRFLIMDNDSSDGTDRVLRSLARDARIHWTRHLGPFRQVSLRNELAREAFRRGADWVVPMDADEFWWTPRRDLRTILAESYAGALQAQVVNFVQRRDQVAATPDALLTMTCRPPRPIGPLSKIMELVETRQIGFVEMLYPPKWMSRATPTLEIALGNHEVAGTVGPPQATDQVVCLHAPLRARSLLEAKADRGRQVEAFSTVPEHSWHLKRWGRIAAEGGLDQEWEANSYADDSLNVYGVRRPLVFDPRLRDAVQPWLELASSSRPVSISVPAGAGAAMRPNGTEAQVQADASSESTGVAVPALDNSFILPALIKAEVDPIEGWLRDEEAELLMVMARRVLIEHGPQPIVEIGSYQGKSTVALARVVKALCPTARVYAIDPHEGEIGALDKLIRHQPPTLEAMQRNLAGAGLTDTVEIIVQLSYKVAWDRPISLLFIDGLHDYLNASRDFYHYESYVVPGGYVAFHDCEPGFPGVVAFVNDVLSGGQYREVERAASVVVLQKVKEAERRTEAAQAPTPLRVLSEDHAAAQRRVRALAEQSTALHHALSTTGADEVRAWLQDAQDQLRQREHELRALQAEHTALRQTASAYEGQLGWIQSSKAWRLLMMYYGARRRLKALLRRPGSL